MADITTTYQIQLRRDTAANWTSVNPVLAEGEQGYETDTRKSKIGNGTDTWNDLSYNKIDNLNIYNAKDYGCICDGITDDYTAFMAMVNTIPLGSTIVIKGLLRFTTPIVISRQISLITPNLTDGFLVDLTDPTEDAITFDRGDGNIAGIQGITLDFNIYGKAETAGTSGNYAVCNNVVVLRHIHRTKKINIMAQCGADGYALVMSGCMINNDVYLDHSVNWSPPVTKRFFAEKHILLQNFGTGGNATGSNANIIKVNLEGRNGGITATNNSSNNTISGCIEGNIGKNFDINNCKDWTIENLYLESSLTTESTFVSCTNFVFKNVNHLGNTLNVNIFTLTTCRSFDFVSYKGSLIINSNCHQTILGNISLNAKDTITNLSTSTNCYGSIQYTYSPDTSLNSVGVPALNNLFHNPYCDIWTNGTSSAPDGFESSTNCTFALETTIVNGLNPMKKSVKVTSTATSISNGCNINLKPLFKNMSIERWVSVTLLLYVPTGQPNIVPYIYCNSGYRGPFSAQTLKDNWIILRGSQLVNANSDVFLALRPYNGSAFVAGEYYIGGLSIVNGNMPSQFIIDSFQRKENYITSIANAPSFIGQEAFVSNVWYKAIGTSSTADWKALN